jgi:hypothetical protein
MAMSEQPVQEEDDFGFDLEGRIRNMGLAATPANALMPLFEAISNAAHAIEARFGELAATNGRIDVEILRRPEDEGSGLHGFVVRDNGVGLTKANFTSFRTADTPAKIKKGGKGVGRLTWLRAFKSTQVASTFEENGKRRRVFTFSLGAGGANPIHGHKVEYTSADIGTEVRLTPFVTEFEAHCPKRTKTIAEKLIAHFLNYFVVGSMPPLVLHDGGNVVDVGQHFQSHQTENTIDVIKISDLLLGEHEIEIHHILLRKELRFDEGGLHWMFYSGNGRSVQQRNVDNQLGLKYIGDDEKCVYVALVTGKFLDDHVDQLRTNFTFDAETMAELHKAALASAKTFLSTHIGAVRTLQREIAAKIIRENPQFFVIAKNLDEFVERLQLSTQSEEDIFLELGRTRFRERRSIGRDLQAIRTNLTPELQSRIGEITGKLNEAKVGSLAEYVVRRKEILELFDSALAYADPDARKYLKEEAVHELICPLRSSSDALEYDDHNLWVLDDRLAFYTFFTSDKPFKTYLDGSSSGRETDITVMFDRALAFQREGGDEPVIIIEFKRPGRNDFDQNSSPVVQVLEYVDEFRNAAAVKDYKGALKKPIAKNTRFICYVVADFTSSLVRVVRNSPANHRSADGEGFFGYSAEHNAFIEVAPYSKILRDARVRNEAFFDRLGLLA